KSGIGQCNNKNNLFVALLRATGYKARIHFGEIRKEILRGLISNNIYNRLPATLSHSWIEVELNGDWKRIDTHILDKKLFLGAKRALKNTNWDMGYAVANISISDFVLHDKLNPGTPIIPKDHGTWDDPMLYYESDQYIKPGLLSKILYLPLAARVNAKLNKLRHESRS
ncbi:transglutaminase domain-containing protein, partial [Patescibacteria group bacterium]|nr:transglutaminase domain-containing protein [Patescibacteria group bacterium]